MKVLIIGLGSIANKHILVLRNLYPSVEFEALRSNTDCSHIEGVKNIFTIEKVSINIDFVIISNPTINHFETIRRVIPLKKPIFIEKPAVHNLKNVKQLLNEIRCNELLTYVACNLRFHPCLLYVKNYLMNNSSKINEVNVYCGSYLPDWRSNVDFRKSYSANKNMGGGVHLDLIHELDYTYYLFGCPSNSNKVFKSNSHLDISSIDYAHYILEYKKFIVNITLNYFRRDPKRKLEIVFENTTLKLDFINNNVSIDGKIVFEYNLGMLYTYSEQMKYFIDCIFNNQQPINSFEESLDVLKICLDEVE